MNPEDRNIEITVSNDEFKSYLRCIATCENTYNITYNGNIFIPAADETSSAASVQFGVLNVHFNIGDRYDITLLMRINEDESFGRSLSG